MSPKVVEYPDSCKLGLMAGTLGRHNPHPDTNRHFANLKDDVDYWEGGR
jgi:hypothetical protein